MLYRQVKKAGNNLGVVQNFIQLKDFSLGYKSVNSYESSKIETCLMDKYLVKIDKYSMDMYLTDLRHGRENTAYFYPLKELNFKQVSQIICLKAIDMFQIVLKKSNQLHVATYRTSHAHNNALRLQSLRLLSSSASSVVRVNTQVIGKTIYTSVVTHNTVVSQEVLRIKYDGPQVWIDTDKFTELKTENSELKIGLEVMATDASSVKKWSKGEVVLKSIQNLSDMVIEYTATQITQPSLLKSSKFFISKFMNIKGAVIDVKIASDSKFKDHTALSSRKLLKYSSLETIDTKNLKFSSFQIEQKWALGVDSHKNQLRVYKNSGKQLKLEDAIKIFPLAGKTNIQYLSSKLVQLNDKVTYIISLTSDLNKMETQKIEIMSVYEQYDADFRKVMPKFSEIASYEVKDDLIDFQLLVMEDTIFLILKVKCDFKPFKIISYKNNDANKWVMKPQINEIGLETAPDMFSAILLDSDIVILYAYFYDPQIYLVRMSQYRSAYGIENKVEFYSDDVQYLMDGATTTLIQNLDCEFREVSNKVYCLVNTLNMNDYLIAIQLDYKANASTKGVRKFVKETKVLNEIFGIQGYTQQRIEYSNEYLVIKMKRNTILKKDFDKEVLKCPYLLVVYRLSFTESKDEEVKKLEKYPFTVFSCEDLGLDKYDLDFNFSVVEKIGTQIWIVNDKQSSNRSTKKQILNVFGVQDNRIEILNNFSSSGSTLPTSSSSGSLQELGQSSGSSGTNLDDLYTKLEIQTLDSSKNKKINVKQLSPFKPIHPPPPHSWWTWQSIALYILGPVVLLCLVAWFLVSRIRQKNRMTEQGMNDRQGYLHSSSMMDEDSKVSEDGKVVGKDKDDVMMSDDDLLPTKI